MLNVPELEQRWKHYRRTRQVPYLVGGGAAVVLVFAATYFLLTPSAPTSSKPQAVVSAPAAPKVTMPAVDSSKQSAAAQGQASDSARPAQTQAVAAEQPALKLTPSMGFMHEFESDVMDYYSHVDTQEPQPQARTQAAPPVYQRPSQQAPAPAPVISTPPKEEIQPINAPAQPSETLPGIQASSSLKAAPPVPAASRAETDDEPSSEEMTILRDDDMKDIQDVIARFKKSKNPILSLFVAKRYYHTGNYQQAYNYALITNELDSTIEDSWLIFAKSLYKMDQKEMAIKTLKSYIQESSSVKAKITLDQMEKGTME
ncbi:hypothetical protein LOH54_03480 [Sulfurimonas sp. HSL-3221]|uniref:hypothetical protein n=1 Tax=Sulfurimonadaceae TaxID=2771471 RepID=UPI001E4CACEE|nr:hypothetical protein [Sulfurimonas sp. HSL-3221]UFS63194.1 hypothetical protein LOH54_03480 [Sulfurimonas sp. HSL-3221]